MAITAKEICEGKTLYFYKFDVEIVKDGDTIVGTLHKGFKGYTKDVTIRFNDINAFETRLRKGKTTPAMKKKGLEGKAHLKELIEGVTVVIRSNIPYEQVLKGNFGRLLADVYYADRRVNDHMVIMGYAVYKKY